MNIEISVLHAGEVMNRRTMVLEPETPDEEWSDIKEQYLEERLHKESSILTKIHTKGIFPGVICLASRHPSLLTGTSVEYDATDGSGPIIRNKIRLWLKGKGDTFLSIKTPRDMLRIIFDVLEVSCKSFECRRVLHRDISINNILGRNELEEYKDTLDHD